MSTPMLNPDNALLTQARSGKLVPPIWVVVPVAFVILILSQLGGIPVAMINLMRRVPDLDVLSRGDPDELISFMLPQTALEQMLFLVSSFVGIYLLIWLWVWAVEGRSLRSLGLPGGKALMKFGRGFGVGALLFALTIIVGRLFGVYRLEAPSVVGASTIGGILLVLLGWLVQGPAEELIFRGWVLPAISTRYTIWLGVFISSLMFAAGHAINPGISLPAIVNLLLFGIFAALYALFEEGLWGVFGIHAVWNWVQGNIFGLEVSGLRPPGRSLFVTQASGLDIWTGGRFGPEGSLFVTLILSGGIVCLFFLNRRGVKKDEAQSNIFGPEE